MKEKAEGHTKRSWTELQTRMWKAIPKKVQKTTPRQNSGWWTTECYNRRKVMMSLLKEARIDKYKWPQYKVAKRSYKDQVKMAKIEHAEKETEKLREINNIGDAWRYINENRNKASQTQLPNNAELAEHFMKLLEGEPITEHGEEEQSESWLKDHTEQEVEVDSEEFERHIKELKEHKAVGPDQLKAELLKLADPETRESIRGVINDSINGRDIPKEWNTARLHPVHKKGDLAVASNYRGIAIVNSAYKLYANILRARLAEFVEEKKLLPDTQSGYREGRSAIDNIYIINHVVGTTLAKNEQLFCAFIDYTAAFDTVDRERLYRKLEKIGIPPYLIRAIKNIYKDTRTRVGETTFRQTSPRMPIKPPSFCAIHRGLRRDFRRAADWRGGSK